MTAPMDESNAMASGLGPPCKERMGLARSLSLSATWSPEEGVENECDGGGGGPGPLARRWSFSRSQRTVTQSGPVPFEQWQLAQAVRPVGQTANNEARGDRPRRFSARRWSARGPRPLKEAPMAATTAPDAKPRRETAASDSRKAQMP